MRKTMTLIACLSPLTVGGCVPEFDTDLSQIADVRVLAIAATPAEAQPRQQVRLEALVVGPEGEPVPAIDWRVCLARKPLTELGPVSPACLAASPAAEDVRRLPRGGEAELMLDQDACKLFGPLRPTPMAGEPAGRPVDPDITGGFYQPVVGVLGRDSSLGAVRISCDPANVNRDEAIEFRERYRPNQAPAIGNVSLREEGGALQTLSEDDALVLGSLAPVALEVDWEACATESTCGDGLCTAFEDNTTCPDDCGATRKGCTGAEPYVWYNRESQRVESRREGISVAWYTSNGHFDEEQTGRDEGEAQSGQATTNTWRPASAGPASVWLVIRDTRGGLSWKTFRFSVTP
jgi:hypothetical protein